MAPVSQELEPPANPGRFRSKPAEAGVVPQAAATDRSAEIWKQSIAEFRAKQTHEDLQRSARHIEAQQKLYPQGSAGALMSNLAYYDTIPTEEALWLVTYRVAFFDLFKSNVAKSGVAFGANNEKIVNQMHDKKDELERKVEDESNDKSNLAATDKSYAEARKLPAVGDATLFNSTSIFGGMSENQIRKFCEVYMPLHKGRAGRSIAHEDCFNLDTLLEEAKATKSFGGASGANAIGSTTYADVQRRKEEARSSAARQQCEAAEERMTEFMANVVFIKRHCPSLVLHQRLRTMAKDLETEDTIPYHPHCDSGISIEGVNTIIHRWTKKADRTQIEGMCISAAHELRKDPPMDGVYGPLVTRRVEERKSVRQRQCVTILGNRVCN